ncbi:LysE/ArgO family amino acid transporter [Streptomyces sp. Qhu-G9]|uniref:LysE/ArgO family amino acid transporter n=1 Tax=Streptomyces sp. Qhu-G9 TaxID=3452799 RepID=UPI0022AC6EB9|nr:LysE/ArgO family amino acid transporter [Streptomyces aurantiacus]WAU81717.1 LysE/ArgO family amino acid transporter [Streptomyces aurantiacus]
MTSTLAAAAAGFGTGLSLIVAIGAQNAFVLRQGIRREAVLAVVGICALSDAALIVLGVGGVGAVVVAWPSVLTAVALVGGLFLIAYGCLAVRRIFRPSALTVTPGTEGVAGSRRRAVLTCLAMTWLNPHVYLDTVFLLGSIAADRGPLRWTFGLGAVLASLVWFAALGFGARLLSRFLARPSAWRVLDALVAATMIALGATLIAGA